MKIPLNQTILNRYTPGGELVYASTGQTYVGSYHIISDKFYTGAIPQPNITGDLLEKIENSKLYSLINTISINKFKKTYTKDFPVSSHTLKPEIKNIFD